MKSRTFLAIAAGSLLVARLWAANAPAVSYTPTPGEIEQITTNLTAFTATIDALRTAKVSDDLLVDVEVNARAVQNVLRYREEFFTKSVVQQALRAITQGMQRARQLQDGHPTWPTATGSVARAMRSRVDGTPQPYRVMIPASYNPKNPMPLYIYLHGRGDTDLGLGWVGGATDRPANGEVTPTPGRPSYIQMQVFGRANVSFRWAAETDVLDAIESVKKRYNIDPDRIVMAGFSMGGAGSWQLGLKMPDQFCGLEIDAGVIGNRRNLDGLTAAQHAANANYGIVIDHAINIVDLPLVGYAGQNDAQLASSTSIREQFATEGFPSDHPSPLQWKAQKNPALYLAIPNQGHSHATGETARLITEFTAASFARGRVVPDRVRYVTYTLRYNHDYWVTVDGLEHQFYRAYVDATRDPAKANFTITTTNISRLILDDSAAARQITIDGDTFDNNAIAKHFMAVQQRPPQTLLVRTAGHWQLSFPGFGSATPLRKTHNLQGPINDAFMDSFLCVTPTGEAFNSIAAQQATQELARFTQMFGKEYRGDARAKADTAISDDDIANNNLVLFGDPGNNRLLARVLDRLPLKWTKDSITLAGKTYSASDHVPVMIYPNPLNPKRYIVLNTGLSAQMRGDAYGDYAILQGAPDAGGKLTLTSADGGVFDESWQPGADKEPAKL
jgi:pimeloyl-ACP methyl ester carboxylesterase